MGVPLYTLLADTPLKNPICANAKLNHFAFVQKIPIKYDYIIIYT